MGTGYFPKGHLRLAALHVNHKCTQHLFVSLSFSHTHTHEKNAQANFPDLPEYIFAYFSSSSSVPLSWPLLSHLHYLVTRSENILSAMYQPLHPAIIAITASLLRGFIQAARPPHVPGSPSPGLEAVWVFKDSTKGTSG